LKLYSVLPEYFLDEGYVIEECLGNILKGKKDNVCKN